MPVTDVPWMRTRETWVHAVDLNGPVTFAGFPPAVADALIANITSGWRRGSAAAGLAFAADDTGQRWGDGPRVITGSRADLLAWTTGRGDESALDGPLFPAPPWI